MNLSDEATALLVACWRRENGEVHLHLAAQDIGLTLQQAMIHLIDLQAEGLVNVSRGKVLLTLKGRHLAQTSHEQVQLAAAVRMAAANAIGGPKKGTVMTLTEREERFIIACFRQNKGDSFNIDKAGAKAGFSPSESNDLASILEEKNVFESITLDGDAHFTSKGRELARTLVEQMNIELAVLRYLRNGKRRAKQDVVNAIVATSNGKLSRETVEQAITRLQMNALVNAARGELEVPSLVITKSGLDTVVAAAPDDKEEGQGPIRTHPQPTEPTVQDHVNAELSAIAMKKLDDEVAKLTDVQRLYMLAIERLGDSISDSAKWQDVRDWIPDADEEVFKTLVFKQLVDSLPGRRFYFKLTPAGFKLLPALHKWCAARRDGKQKNEPMTAGTPSTQMRTFVFKDAIFTPRKKPKNEPLTFVFNDAVIDEDIPSTTPKNRGKLLDIVIALITVAVIIIGYESPWLWKNDPWVFWNQNLPAAIFGGIVILAFSFLSSKLGAK